LPGIAAKEGRFLAIDARNHFRAGCALSQALASLGHAQGAFFSPFHADTWSHACLEGVRSRDFAPGFSIVPYVIGGSQIATTPEINELIKPIHARLRSGFERNKSTLPLPYVRQLTPFFHHMLGDHIVFAEVRNRLQPLFKKAAANKQATCWIAASSETASFALDYIAENNFKVSLVSFDWSQEFTERRIASYDFNPAAAARAAMEFIRSPHRRLPGQEGFRLPIEGTLLFRDTLKKNYGQSNR
jgi:hypothetical protein